MKSFWAPLLIHTFRHIIVLQAEASEDFPVVGFGGENSCKSVNFLCPVNSILIYQTGIKKPESDYQIQAFPT